MQQQSTDCQVHYHTYVPPSSAFAMTDAAITAIAFGYGSGWLPTLPSAVA